MASSEPAEHVGRERRRVLGLATTVLLAGRASRVRGAPAAVPAGRFAAFRLAYDGFLELGERSMRIATAKLAFEPGPERYRLSLDVDSLVAQLHYGSEGLLGESGLRPRHYSERREVPLRRARVREVRYVETDRPGLAAGAGTLVVPAGTQDRLSIIAHVSALARREGDRFGARRISLHLAGIGSVIPVDLQVDPPAPFEAGGLMIDAWRVHRLEGQGDDGDLDVEVWLAREPSRRPVGIRFRDGTRALRFVLADPGR